MRQPSEKDIDYCRRIILEVDDFIPTPYIKYIRKMEEDRNLKPIIETRLRNVRAGITPDVTYAELLHELGTILKEALVSKGSILDVNDIPKHLQPSH